MHYDASLQICIHPIYGRILILPHRNDETLLPIDDLRMNLRSLLRLYMKHHIISLNLGSVIINLFLLLKKL